MYLPAQAALPASSPPISPMAQNLGARAKCRSRSAPRTGKGWAPIRADAPGRLPRRRGSFPDLSTPVARAQAVEEFRADIYAASSVPGIKSRLRFLAKALRPWQQTPWPITIKKIERIGSALKKGGYRSADSYLSQYRVSAERRGYEITGPLRRAFKDADRTCMRGIGPGVKSLGLPMHRLQELPGNHRPWVAGGPVSPRCAMVVGSWFLTREVELATSRACLVSVTEGECPSVSWCLPASKADTRAVGIERIHYCECVNESSADCPVCAMRAHLAFLAKAFPDQLEDGEVQSGLPPLP